MYSLKKLNKNKKTRYFKKTCPFKQKGVSKPVNQALLIFLLNNIIKENENITIPELSKEIAIGERQIMRILNKLKEKEVIKSEGSNKSETI